MAHLAALAVGYPKAEEVLGLFGTCEQPNELHRAGVGLSFSIAEL